MLFTDRLQSLKMFTLQAKRQQLRDVVAKRFKIQTSKTSPFVVCWNSIVTLVEILPLLALRFIEYPIFIIFDHFLSTFLLFSLTLLLLFLRAAFMELAPIIASHLGEFFLGLNTLFWHMQITKFEKESLVSKLKNVGYDASFVAFDATLISDESAIHNFLVETPKECASFNSAWVILQRMFQSFASEGVCETLRYLIPSQELYVPVNSLAGWMSIENPVTLTSTCEPAPQIDIFCTVLGTGYVFAQLVLPIYLVTMFLVLAREEVWELIKTVFILAFGLVEIPLKISETIVNLL